MAEADICPHYFVTEDFLPIISRIKASTAPFGGPKGEISYAREHESVWFKGKRFTPAVWAGTPGEVQIKQLRAAVDSKGRKVGEEWFTTAKVEDALTRYHEAGAKAKAKVLELLRTLSTELEAQINILVFSSTLLVIAKALFAHVRFLTMHGNLFFLMMRNHPKAVPHLGPPLQDTLWHLQCQCQLKGWVFEVQGKARGTPRRTLALIPVGEFASIERPFGVRVPLLVSYLVWIRVIKQEDYQNKPEIYSSSSLNNLKIVYWLGPLILFYILAYEDTESLDAADGMKITGLSPYWFDIAQGSAVQNTVDMQSLFLLTGPNGGGKSSLLRSICAASLLGICGLMIPAESALIPHFDSIMLHMKSYDSPSDGKSSFQIEMSEIRSIMTGATSRSLVLVDEICRGTETAKGTCIAGSIVETLDEIGCLGIVSTHLHGIFNLPLETKHTVHKALATEYVDGLTKPTWKLIDGICKESLAFETAQKEGIPEAIIQRAEELYFSVYKKDALMERNDTKLEVESTNRMEILRNEVESAVTILCQKKLIELYGKENTSELVEVNCVAIAAREQPPPSTIGSSSVYVMLRPDKKTICWRGNIVMSLNALREKTYVTDDLDGRIRAHRSKDGMHNVSFLYFLVPGKSLACQLETFLINQLPNQGFQLINLADGKHRNFWHFSFLLGKCNLA
ncbi:MUTL protein homolog 1 [Actinidia rufa]|uniref:MUTL protein homolog 1 n=1 Tax=Actinidia rufa TaxID=165716 RepID=A0A7J0E5T3_9ERIC|nr:MUTL protein homolog 1 [Actinidia rufa]